MTVGMDYADLIDFARARIDDDERMAHAADPGPWEVGPTFGARDNRVYIRQEGMLVDTVGTLAFVGQVANKTRFRENAQHIARHDPARVLAEVDAKRRILEYIAYELEDHGADNPWWYDDKIKPVLRMLALPYAGHADYRPEWAPQ